MAPFVGNTLRGALGRALREQQDGGAFEGIFKVASETSIPNPFAISAPYPSKGLYAKGEELAFYIALFGRACEYAPEVIEAAKNICMGKLANTICLRIELMFDRDWSESGADAIPYCEMLSVTFISPTEILSSKKPVIEIGFSTFIDSLFGRINGIIDNYTDSQFIIPYSFIADMPRIQAEFDLQSIDLQTNGHPIKSFIGTIKYQGDVTRYLPYIDLGSQLHIGKKTTRACGEYIFDCGSNV